MKMPNLAQTFRSVAEHGKAGFYKGRVAEAIVELIQSKGGVMTTEDLARHDTEFVEPIKYTFSNEVTLYECPPNGQGAIQFPLYTLGLHSTPQALPRSLHWGFLIISKSKGR